MNSTSIHALADSGGCGHGIFALSHRRYIDQTAFHERKDKEVDSPLNGTAPATNAPATKMRVTIELLPDAAALVGNQSKRAAISELPVIGPIQNLA